MRIAPARLLWSTSPPTLATSPANLFAGMGRPRLPSRGKFRALCSRGLHGRAVIFCIGIETISRGLRSGDRGYRRAPARQLAAATERPASRSRGRRRGFPGVRDPETGCPSTPGRPRNAAPRPAPGRSIEQQTRCPTAYARKARRRPPSARRRAIKRSARAYFVGLLAMRATIAKQVPTWAALKNVR